MFSLRSLAVAALLLVGAGASAQLLQHHEIRADALPAPFATASANNAPRIVARPANSTLALPPGFTIAVFASGLSNPRMMVLAPNDDVFVSEPGAGIVTVLRDTKGAGAPDQRFTFASGLNQPFGLAFYQGYLYVGEMDAVVRFPYRSGQTSADRAPEQIASLPSGGHTTRNIIFSPDATKLYVSVGSSSNASPESNASRAAITEMNPDGSGSRVFASGLRNPVGAGL